MVFSASGRRLTSTAGSVPGARHRRSAAAQHRLDPLDARRTASADYRVSVLSGRAPVVHCKVAGPAPGLGDDIRQPGFAHLTVLKILNEIELGARQYLLTVTLINFAVGVITGAICVVDGMPNPVGFGALAATLNFIPVVGPMATFFGARVGRGW